MDAEQQPKNAAYGRGVTRSSGSIALSIMLLLAGCDLWPAPSDASIIERFNSHRPEFNRLLEMFRHDGVFGHFHCNIPPSVPLDAPPVSQERRAEYAKIMKAIGGDCGAYYDFGSGRAEFFMWSTGMLFAGQGKSIVYIPGGELPHVVSSTDGYRWTPEDHRMGSVTLYRQIEGLWYLLYQAN